MVLSHAGAFERGFSSIHRTQIAKNTDRRIKVGPSLALPLPILNQRSELASLETILSSLHCAFGAMSASWFVTTLALGECPADR